MHRIRARASALPLAIAVAPNGRRCAADTAHAGKPQYGAWGFDAAGEDTSVKPGDDFFRYANGAWLDRTQIPADKPRRQPAPGDDATGPRRGCTTMMEAGRRKAEHQPADDRRQGRAPSTRPSWTRRASSSWARSRSRRSSTRSAPRTTRDDARRADGPQPTSTSKARSSASASTSTSRTRSTTPSIVGQAGLGLPDRDYYLKPAFAAQKAAYQAYVAQAAAPGRLAGRRARAAEDVVAFETADRRGQLDQGAAARPGRDLQSR